MTQSLIYPDAPGARKRWIEAKRGPKNKRDPQKPYAFLWEEEPDENGELTPTATMFLTNKECPYRCVMCDLWRDTLDETVPSGAIAAQIRHALKCLPPARQIKLYNAGSFFDPQAIPPEDDAEIAETVRKFERVIVECHPKFVGPRASRFQSLLGGKLEIAIGLETAHEPTLARLNKGFTLEDFTAAAAFLRQNQMDLRVFLLVRPPFQSEADGLFWAARSLEFAFDNGAKVAVLIPTRGGNGAMESLAASGDFSPPSLVSLESALEFGLNLRRGLVFADVWDAEKFFSRPDDAARLARLVSMNRTQKVDHEF